MASIPATALEALKAVAYFVAWPGLLAVSAVVLLRAVRFQEQVKGQPVGRLVLLMVVGTVMTWGAFAGFATYDLSQRDQAATIVLPLFLLWAGSMVLITWIMHRWGAEAVKLNVYHAELAHMDEIKARLINTVAHDINTPLTPIRFRVSTLKSGGLGPVVPRQVEALESIDRNLDRVDAIVGLMVLAMQLQTGKLQIYPKPIQLGPVLAEVGQRFAGAGREKGVEVRVETEQAPLALADAPRLVEAVQQLVSNAVKFTSAGGTVVVRARNVGGEAAIEVVDTGLGLTPEQQASLFQPLKQAHTMNMTETGAGLGLFIAQSIARLHGGRITVASDGPGKGSTFRLMLRLAPTA